MMLGPFEVGDLVGFCLIFDVFHYILMICIDFRRFPSIYIAIPIGIHYFTSRRQNIDDPTFQ